MKKLLFIIAICLGGTSYAVTPTVSCPSGYTMVTENSFVVQDASCPSGYSNVGTTDTCLVATPSGVCFMYAPANTDFSNSTGGYQFIEICPLT